MFGMKFLDAEVFAIRFWVGGFGGIIGAQEPRAADARCVRLLTSLFGEAVQKVCDKFGGDLLGAFRRQHGGFLFACIADYRKTFPWSRAATYPTMRRIHEGLGAGFIRTSVYDTNGQPLENMAAAAMFNDQQLAPDEAWRYVDDTTMPIVSLNAAADSAAQLGRLTDELVQSFSGRQIFAGLKQLATEFVRTVSLTASDKRKV